jgi:hypothetical protein
MFQHSYHGRENSCTWLTVSLLIHTIDKRAGEEMISMYSDDYERFEWLGFTKLSHDIKSFKNQFGHETLQDILQGCNVGYQLKKVKLKQNQNCHMDTLLNESATGLYICCLSTNFGFTSHVIGIDCSKQKIYDCEETHELPLNKENIDKCCGGNSGGIKEIRLCFLIDPRQRKKQKNS